MMFYFGCVTKDSIMVSKNILWTDTKSTCKSGKKLNKIKEEIETSEYPIKKPHNRKQQDWFCMWITVYSYCQKMRCYKITFTQITNGSRYVGAFESQKLSSMSSNLFTIWLVFIFQFSRFRFYMVDKWWCKKPRQITGLFNDWNTFHQILGLRFGNAVEFLTQFYVAAVFLNSNFRSALSRLFAKIWLMVHVLYEI